MIRAWIAIILLALGVAAAVAMPASQQIIMFGKGSSASNPPPPTGKILLVDGSSHLLQIDGASKICIAGGC